ncbi:tyrosine-type recombinase/integrase [Geomonas ferrireducens]|uniref:tyrosine-type recombinase/integrase n=1 Tax=Geomonas ferrireducens TaxID=2570227 RepID=UPI0013A5D7E0|nr:tyrosine-type recombinase/integrase [Geomonas ferrireducens]
MKAVSSTKEFATTYLLRKIHEVETDKYMPSDRRLTWTEAVKLYEVYLESKKTVTARFYQQRIDTFLTPFFYGFSVKGQAELPPELARRLPEHINDFLPQHLDAYMVYCRREWRHTNSTINRARSTILNMFNCFVRGRILALDGSRYLSYNQLAIVPALQENDSRESSFFAAAQIKLILEEAGKIDKRLPPMIGLGCFAGLRRRTICTIKKSYFNFKENTIALPASSRKRGEYIHYVIIIPALARLFEKYLAQLSPQEVASEWMFCGDRSPRHISFSFFDTHFKKVLKRCHIENKRFHDTKHTAGTYMYAATRDIRVVADFLDHADINQSRKYASLSMEQLKKAMGKFAKELKSTA